MIGKHESDWEFRERLVKPENRLGKLRTMGNLIKHGET
jgi:hypothetical protein